MRKRVRGTVVIGSGRSSPGRADDYLHGRDAAAKASGAGEFVAEVDSVVVTDYIAKGCKSTSMTVFAMTAELLTLGLHLAPTQHGSSAHVLSAWLIRRRLRSSADIAKPFELLIRSCPHSGPNLSEQA